MSNRFANGRKSFGFCDLCGFRYDLKKLRNLVVKTKQTEIKACNACWVPDQPQLLLGTFPVSDPQAIRNPRPDTNTWYQSGVNALGNVSEGMLVIQWGWNPVGGSSYFDAPLTPNTLVGVGEMGAVTTGDTGTPQFTLVEVLYTTPGTYSWIAPADVTSIYVLCVGGGGSGSFTGVNSSASSFDTLFAGPGARGSNSGSSNLAPGGTGTPLGGNIYGGNGGDGWPGVSTSQPGGGGGAGGYSGNGGVGGNSFFGFGSAGTGGGGGGGRAGILQGAGGGGVGLNGEGVSGGAPGNSAIINPGFGGSGGQNATNARGGLYGGGGGGTNFTSRGGGGGGGLRWTPFFAVTPGNTYTVVVGQAGDPTGASRGGHGAVKIAYWLPVP